jgi:ubiquinone/menaquinone biosynthesis C-methylase UbiE
MAAEPDRWSRWHSDRRDGGDAREREATLSRLRDVRDSLLRAAGPLAGATLLDVGSGDGLVGLGALDLVGPTGVVIFSDISAPLLEHCRQAVAARGASERARFVITRAEDLAEIPDASIDAVTVRAVLAFLSDKPSTFAAMYRVLRPGGRISVREAIGKLMFPEPSERFWGYDLSSVIGLNAKVKDAFAALEDAGYRSAAMSFDDRDLAHFAETAGFERVHVECHIDIEPGSMMRRSSLRALLASAPTPTAPTIGEAVQAALSEAEQERFLSELERAILEDKPVRRTALAHLTATKAPGPQVNAPASDLLASRDH